MLIELDSPISFKSNVSYDDTCGMYLKFFTYKKKVNADFEIIITDSNSGLVFKKKYKRKLIDGELKYFEFNRYVSIKENYNILIAAIADSNLAMPLLKSDYCLYNIARYNINRVANKIVLVTKSNIKGSVYHLFDYGKRLGKIYLDHFQEYKKQSKIVSPVIISNYYHFEKSLFGKLSDIFLISNRRLKILTHRWHVGHQYELYKLGHRFDLIAGFGSDFSQLWDYNQRPLPPNAKFVPFDDLKLNQYDLIILHFDENVLSPNLTNGAVDYRWGEVFKYLLSVENIPKIAICHGTPQFYGQYNTDPGQNSLGAVINESLVNFRELLRDVHVVCNSHQAEQEWGFYKSSTIWHGIEYLPFFNGLKDRGILSISDSALNQRPVYRGKKYFDHVMSSSLLVRDSLEPLRVECPFTHNNNNFYAHVKFISYVKELSRYKIYFNPTVRSPMPRSRTESMLSGSVSVSLNNHDVCMFIKNGVDGFFSDDAEELASQMEFLLRNDRVRLEISERSIETAKKAFAIERYLADWRSLVKKVI